jgi:hypothetical protein
MEAFFLWTPFVLAWASAKAGSDGIPFLFTLLTVPILITFAWFVAIIRRRREIWGPSRSFCAGLGDIWGTTVKNYPFLLFCSAVVMPTAYWILTIEIGIVGQNDEISSLTFSQVLAMFAAVPPVIEVAPLVPRLWEWFITFSWLGRVIRHSKTFSPSQDGLFSGSPIEEKGQNFPFELQTPPLQRIPAVLTKP